MKASAIRDLTVNEIELAVLEINKEIYNLVNENKRAKKVEKPSLIRQKKKDRARLLTIQHEKQSVRA